jgi:hypothetical protein
VPDSKIDAVDALAEQVEDLTARLDATMNEVLELREANEEFYKAEIIAEQALDLPLSQREKLSTLCEGFVVDDQLVNKIQVVKEKHFGIKAPKESNFLSETFEQPMGEKKNPDKQMQNYIDVAASILNKS